GGGGGGGGVGGRGCEWGGRVEPVRGQERCQSPMTWSQISLPLRAMISAAISPAKIVNHLGETSAPILLRSAVNCTSGTTAKGSCKLRTTWVRINNLPAA